jgi:hypothetical protein
LCVQNPVFEPSTVRNPISDILARQVGGCGALSTSASPWFYPAASVCAAGARWRPPRSPSPTPTLALEPHALSTSRRLPPTARSLPLPHRTRVSFPPPKGATTRPRRRWHCSWRRSCCATSPRRLGRMLGLCASRSLSRPLVLLCPARRLPHHLSTSCRRAAAAQRLPHRLSTSCRRVAAQHLTPLRRRRAHTPRVRRYSPPTAPPLRTTSSSSKH